MAANHTTFYSAGNHKQFWKPCMNDCVCKQHGSGKKLKNKSNDTVWNSVSLDASVVVGFLQLVLLYLLVNYLFVVYIKCCQ